MMAALRSILSSPVRRLLLLLVPLAIPGLMSLQDDLRVTPDSTAYLQAAASIGSGHGIPPDYVHWPPLYPALLSLGQRAGLDLMQFARLLNQTLYVALLALTAVMSLMLFHKPAAQLAFPVMLALGTPIMLVYGFAWSEPLFITLATAALVFTLHAVRNACRPVDLALAGICTGLCLVTRHVGIALPAALVPVILLARDCTWKTRLMFPAVVFVAALPYAWWSLAVRSHTGELTGARPESLQSMHDIVSLSADVIAHWLLPHSYFDTGGLPLLCGLACIGLAAWLWLQRRRPADRVPAARTGFPAHVVMAAFTACYLLVYITVASIYRIDPPSDRLLAPVYLPVIACVLLFAQRLYRDTQRYAPAHYAVALRYLGTGYALYWISAPNSLTDLLT